MIAEEQLIRIGPWKGVNNVDGEESLDPEELREAINADIDRKGDTRVRDGQTKRVSLTKGRSVFSNGNLLVVVDGSTLISLTKTGTDTFEKTNLRTDLDPELPVSYCDVQGTIYYSNGKQAGRILPTANLMPIGVVVPDPPTLTAQTGGNLSAGDYQVCLTNVDATGEESGSTLANVVTVSAGGYVTLTDIPQMAGVSWVRVYMTSANGDEFFRHVEIPIGVTTYNITTTIRGPGLETQFAEPMPAGHIVRAYRGRLYIATDTVVWFSEPLRYGLNKPLDGYFPEFAERIKALEPVHDGLFVVADKAYFLSGTDPHKMIPVVAHPHRGVEGTGTQVPAKMFGANEAPGTLAYWFSENGPCVGFPGGMVSPVTENKIAHAFYGSGASLFREVEGIRSVVTTLHGKGAESGFGATDSLIFEKRRNGILVD